MTRCAGRDLQRRAIGGRRARLPALLWRWLCTDRLPESPGALLRSDLTLTAEPLLLPENARAADAPTPRPIKRTAASATILFMLVTIRTCLARSPIGFYARLSPKIKRASVGRANCRLRWRNFVFTSTAPLRHCSTHATQPIAEAMQRPDVIPMKNVVVGSTFSTRKRMFTLRRLNAQQQWPVPSVFER
jgi:hypothetical protein